MFKSSVMAIIMATNIFGGSCSNENVKVEDVTPTNEVVMEEENIIEEYEEIEKMYKQQKIEWEEKVKYEVENNPSFEEDFNKLQEIEDKVLNLGNGILYSYYDDHEKEKGEYIQTIFDEVELEEDSVLNELRTLMILHHRWGNSDSYTKQCDLEEIIRYYL